MRSIWPETVRELSLATDALRARRYGVIEVAAGRLVGVHLRPFPKWATLGTVATGWLWHRYARGDRCWLYYNQPRGHDRFLALKYTVSSCDCRWATIVCAREALESIAEIKGVDALLCDAANARISHRLLTRWGWERHALSRWHRNYIKRLDFRGVAVGYEPPAYQSANDVVVVGQGSP